MAEPLSETGSELEDSLESDVEANLEELTETSLKVFLALALQDKPNLTVIKNALKLSLGELDEAREELILNGLINVDTQILAQHMARNWLVERPTERMSESTTHFAPAFFSPSSTNSPRRWWSHRTLDSW